MKLSKSIEIALCIAASGSVMMVLSGSAFAAESGSGITAQAMVQSDKDHLMKTGNASRQIVLNMNESISLTHSQKSGDAPIVGSEVTLVHTSSGSLSLSPTFSDSLVTAISGVTTNEPNITFGNTKLALSEDTATPEVLNTSLSRVLKFSSIERIQNPAIQESESIIFKSAMLPIQPRITTGRAVQIIDLASFVPTAFDQSENSTQVPAPTHPNGVLGELIAVLADSIVPSVTYTCMVIIAGFGALLMLVVLANILRISGRYYSFASWLRRGGYMHAARSDVGHAMSDLFFATPLEMSYVPAQMPPRSSFLMVSDMKTFVLTT